MEPNAPTPLLYAQTVAEGMKWPAIVAAAFWAGRTVQRLEIRISKAEHRIEALTTRHMPAVHKALAEIRGLLSRS